MIDYTGLRSGFPDISRNISMVQKSLFIIYICNIIDQLSRNKVLLIIMEEITIFDTMQPSNVRSILLIVSDILSELEPYTKGEWYDFDFKPNDVSAIMNKLKRYDRENNLGLVKDVIYEKFENSNFINNNFEMKIEMKIEMKKCIVNSHMKAKKTLRSLERQEIGNLYSLFSTKYKKLH
jgi:hypothetical protein